MTTSKAVSRLMAASIEVFKLHPHLAPNRCILATAVGLDVLKHFGLLARPLSVKVAVLSPAWVRWHQAGRPNLTLMELADLGVWALTCGFPPDPGMTLGASVPGNNAWNGHLLIEVPAVKQLVDLNTGQFSRPAKDILFPAVMAWDWNGQVVSREFGHGMAIRIEPKRDDVSYTAAVDWWNVDRRRPIVDEIVKLVRKG